MEENKKSVKNLAVFISGRGSNLQAIIDAIKNKTLQRCKIQIVISNKEDALGLKRAKEADIETIFLDPSKYSSREQFDQAAHEILIKYKIDYVILAGYMRIMSTEFVRKWKMRIINIHPALLPAFPGLHPHRQAFEYGVIYSGCTTHFITEEVDAGPIIMQAVVPINELDTEETLSEKILLEEHKIYPLTVQLLVDDKIIIDGRKTRTKS